MNLRYYKKIFLSSILVGGCAVHSIAQQASGDSSVLSMLFKKDTVRHIGYGAQNPLFTTGSISTVKGVQLERNFNTNLGNKLYGQLSGLSVAQNSTESDLFGSKPTLYSRGIASYQNTNIETVGNEPLVVVDGFVSTFDALVAEEIEEISLLKDASAAAVFGMRAANGVLLVTTKRGGISPLKINFSAQTGFGQGMDIPKPLDSYTYATLYNQAVANTGSSQFQPFNSTALEAFQTGSDPVLYPNVNWYNELFRKTAPVSNYGLNFRGGDQTVKYFVLINAVNNQTLLKNFGADNEESSNSKYSRYNFRTNLDVNLTKRLSATLLVGASLENKTMPGNIDQNFTAAQVLGNVRSIRPNAFPIYVPDNSVTSTGAAVPNGSFAGRNDLTNPLANTSQTGFSNTEGRTLQSALKFKQQLDFLTEGLSASAGISFNSYFRTAEIKRRDVQTYQIDATNPAAIKFNPVLPTPNFVLTGGDAYPSGQFRTYALQGMINYDRVFGAHNISGLFGLNADNYNVTPVAQAATNNTLPFKSNNFFNRITYVNNNKYIAEFSSSYMGTENFEEGNRYGFFPAGSLGWIASNEDFLKNNKAITFLKLRGSYGLVGNDKLGARFSYEQRYPFTGGFNFGDAGTGVAGITEGRPSNPNLTWEKEKRANIGFESTFFNQLSISVDLFKHDRYDLLPSLNGGANIDLSNTTPQYMGFTEFPLFNQGEVTNRGFEAVLGFNSKPAKRFAYFARANVFYNQNEIVSDGQPIQINSGTVRAGNPVSTRYGYKALGLFQTDAEAAAAAKPAGYIAKAGDIKYQDVGGPNGVPDGLIDGNDAQPLRNAGEVPRFTIGLHSGFQYKGFDFDFVLQGVTGSTVYLGSSYYQPFNSVNNAVSEVALDAWTPENTSAEFPRLTFSNLNNYSNSSFYERNGSFIKLRSAELGYTLPVSLVKRARMTSGRIFINGTNLLTLDKVKFGDVESIGMGSYPPIRTISLGAKVGF